MSATTTTTTTTTTTATATVPSTVTTWSIDPAHTSVEFAVRHLMISTVKGRFADVKGAVVTDPTDPTRSTVDVTIDAGSIDTRQAQRDAHLRSADFFDAETFPTLTFRSRKVTNVREEGFTLVGDLSIRGVTREVSLDVVAHGHTKDPWGGERLGFEATGKIRRSDYGLTWNQALETGGVVVGEEVKISIDAELIKVS
jgi:polyisoprenoid-binding protein YceI